MTLFSPVVSVDWLAQMLGRSDLVVLDASMAPPGQPTYSPDGIIPSAQRFDFDKQVCDQCSDLPHMMPSAEQFTQAAQALGINQDSTIVVYDHIGLFASPRAWWMLRSMGHKNVYVLDGGLPAWRAAGQELIGDYSPAVRAGDFAADYQSGAIVSAGQVLAAINQGAPTIWDARPTGRFTGTMPEPRPGLRSGHMPGAVSLPFSVVQNQGQLLPVDSLKALLGQSRPIICSCGSGVTACVLALAAVAAGFGQVAVYDGSWSEWGKPELNLPVVADPPS